MVKKGTTDESTSPELQDATHEASAAESHIDDRPAEPKDETAATSAPKPTGKNWFKDWSKRKIAMVSAAAVVLLLAIVFTIPATRYGILGTFIKRDVTVTLHDSKTNKPVTNVAVGLGGASAVTDAKGVAHFRAVPVGNQRLTIHKKYYKDATQTELVEIGGASPAFSIAIEATGRQVPVKVVNKISQQPVANAAITVEDASSTTDKNGEATVVLPADKADVAATISLTGYNTQSVSVLVTEQQDAKNTFAVVPSGKLYFLSKRSGTIDVLKSDMDGANVQTAVKGTGKEDDRGTVLLAARDWKYLALLATRDSDRPKLYLIDTSSDKLSVIDEGDAVFTAVGWYNHNFIYSVERDKLDSWTPKREALKSFDAQAGKLLTLDETNAQGHSQADAMYESISDIYIMSNELVYAKNWYYSQLGDLSGKALTINSVRPDGGNKKVLKSFPQTADRTYLSNIKLEKPQELYFMVYEGNKASGWSYEDGKINEEKNLTDSDFFKYYPTYLVSPSGNNTFWYEPRDGKNTLFVGDAEGSNGKEIANLSEYTPYGWYSDNYLLVSKGGSELYVISRDNASNPLKVTDYHKPGFGLPGYGYGYGGL